MLSLLGKRLLQLIPTLFFVSVIIFSLQQLLPGDPALIMAGEERDPAVIEQIRQQYHLDRPIPVQYLYWVQGVLSGNLGESMRIHVPVLDLILQKLPVTIQLASMAIVIALVIGIGAGIISAVKKNTAWDYAANAFALWNHADLSVFREVGLVAGVGLRAAHRGLAGKSCVYDHAGIRPRQLDRRGPDATYAQRHAASARKRLRAYGTRQGPV